MLINVLISLGTSVIVGFFTFVFGVKSGKDQADRSRAQEIYTELLNEFESIESNLDIRPRIWDDFPQRKTRHEAIALTPLREILDNGRYVFIDNGQLSTLENLEKDALSYGWEVLTLVRKVPLILEKNPELFETQGIYQSGDSGKTAVYCMMGPANPGTRHRYANVYDFLHENRLASQLEDECEITFNRDPSPGFVSVTIIPELLAVTPSDFSRVVNTKLMIDEGGKDILSKRTDLKKRLDAQIDLLRKQARDPFPFWKTLFSAILDIGKNY